MADRPLPAATLADGLAGLTPACFGIVMATGIVSLACAAMALPALALALFILNAVLYGALWVLLAARSWRHPRRVLDDLSDHGRGPGFFTIVAGTGVLGMQWIRIAAVPAAVPAAALTLWWLALGLWLLITYAVFAVLTVKRDKPALDQGINGGWLLAVVATQSVAALGTALAPHLPPDWRPVQAFLSLSMWLWGGMLYIWMMSLIFYRYTFYRLSPADLAPPYWINMGAMAISTLAGAGLVLQAAQLPLLQSLQPFLKGFTVFYWASGTWWIPMLLVLGVWRHIIRRYPLRYDPLYWGAVFPLGMYALATLEMARALDLPFLAWVPPVFLAAALAAWALAMTGLLADLAQRVAATLALRRSAALSAARATGQNRTTDP